MGLTAFFKASNLYHDLCELVTMYRIKPAKPMVHSLDKHKSSLLLAEIWHNDL